MGGKGGCEAFTLTHFGCFVSVYPLRVIEK